MNLSKQDFIGIVHKHFTGESLKAIATGHGISEKALIQFKNQNQAEWTHYESQFKQAAVNRLTAGDPVRKAKYGFILSAFFLAPTREQLAKTIMSVSQRNKNSDLHIHTNEDAESLIEEFESDWGITLL